MAHWFQDSTLYVAIILSVFAILFGARHLDASERHEGLVAAIALEHLGGRLESLTEEQEAYLRSWESGT